MTKSGTNTLHGSAFLFARDDAELGDVLRGSAGHRQAAVRAAADWWHVGGPIRKDIAHYFVVLRVQPPAGLRHVNTDGVLPEEEGPQQKPFRNHLFTAKTDFTLNDANSMIVRYSREDNKREHDFIGGNTLKSAGALNTNVIDSVIVKNTSVIGGSKVNEALVLFQYFDNNITANDPSRPSIATPDFTFGANTNTPQQTIQRRWQFKDDFAFRKEGWGGDHDFKVGAEIVKSHYGGFFIPTLYGFFNFSQRAAGEQHRCVPQLDRGFVHRVGRHQRGGRQLDARGRLFPGRLPSHRTADAQPGAAIRTAAGPVQQRFPDPVLTDLGRLGYNNTPQARHEQLRPPPRVRLRRGRRRQDGHTRRLRDLLRRDLPEHHAVRTVDRRPDAAQLRVVLADAMDAGLLRGEP